MVIIYTIFRQFMPNIRQRFQEKTSAKPPPYPGNRKPKSAGGGESLNTTRYVLVLLVLSALGFSITTFLYSSQTAPVISKLPNASLENSYDKVGYLIYCIVFEMNSLFCNVSIYEFFSMLGAPTDLSSTLDSKLGSHNRLCLGLSGTNCLKKPSGPSDIGAIKVKASSIFGPKATDRHSDIRISSMKNCLLQQIG